MAASRARISLRSVAFLILAAVLLVGGVAAVMRVTTDRLLFWDATATAESWARSVVENVIDIEDIAAGKLPSADSMQFFLRAQQIRSVFGFEVLDLDGRVQLASDGVRIATTPDGAISAAAVRAARTGLPVVAMKEGSPPIRPRLYSEAFVPVDVAGRPRAVVAAYIDLADRQRHFETAFIFAALALCLLTGAALGIPTLAWYRRTLEKRHADDRIHFLVHHDVLTGLPNRQQLVDSLSAAIDRPAGAAPCLALHYLDLDRFKSINDTLGHDGGDRLLQSTAQRLRAVVGAGGIVARLGGDEFAVLQTGIRGRQEAETLARSIIEALTAPFELNGHELQVTTSVGIAVAPADGSDPARLAKSADLALYRSKHDGRNCLRFFESGMDAELAHRLGIEKAIREAVNGETFELHFQPLVDMPGENLIGFEALLRLRGEDGEFIPPKTFIPVAEEMGLIDRIGRWVLRRACLTAATWPEPLSLAVNLSPSQFSSGDICTTVGEALAESGLAPGRLELEITETLLLYDTERVMDTLGRLKRMGVGIAMDDFGTGYSSLSYLSRFPFDKIKIDGSFIQALDTSTHDVETVVRTIIALGRALTVRVAVEGVETDRQIAFARDIECDEVQGFYIGRPAPAADIAGHVLGSFLDRARRDAASRPDKTGTSAIAGSADA